MGWNPTLGLGRNEDGRTTNIAVAMKLDQLGIGAGRGGGAMDKDGVAWKQQSEFERMLARLNSSSATPSGSSTPQESTGVVAGLGFAPASESKETSAIDSEPTDSPSSAKQKKDKKRKRSQFEIEEETSSSPAVVSETIISSPTAVDSPPSTQEVATPAPPPRRFA